jgi:protein involved in polysaccharide export with SLBB domain
MPDTCRLFLRSVFWPSTVKSTTLLVLMLLGLQSLPGLSAAETNGNSFPATSADLFRDPPSLLIATNAVISDTNSASRFPILAIQSMDRLDDRQKLGIGDKLIYRVIEDQDDPQSLTITDSGDVYIPYYGGLVRAVDKTCRQLAEEIKKLLEKDLYKRATVIIGLETLNKTNTGRKVYVSGHVRLPGPQEIPGGEPFTVSKAILRAGGFSDFAKGTQVKITRANTEKGSRIITVNVVDILEKGKIENDVLLEPGDLIFVPSRTFNF